MKTDINKIIKTLETVINWEDNEVDPIKAIFYKEECKILLKAINSFNIQSSITETEKNERKLLLELQSNKTRFFSEEEFNRLQYLNNKMRDLSNNSEAMKCISVKEDKAIITDNKTLPKKFQFKCYKHSFEQCKKLGIKFDNLDMQSLKNCLFPFVIVRNNQITHFRLTSSDIEEISLAEYLTNKEK